MSSNAGSLVKRQVAELKTLLAELHPDDIALSEITDLFADVNTGCNLMNALRLKLLQRVKESNVAARAGQSTAEWVANQTGESVGKARADLDTSDRLAASPLTDQELSQGNLSAAQAGAITDANAVNPGSEADLIETARKDSLKELKAEAERRKAETDRDRDAARARAHKERSVREWTKGETGFLLVKGPKATVADMSQSLRPSVDKMFRRPVAPSEREPREAYAFDALHQICTTGHGAGSSSLRRQMLIRVDLTALVRGEMAEGEICEIDGIGPILISEARALLGDAQLRLVLTNGVAVGNVVSLGRGPTVAQEIALLWERQRCIVQGCDRSVRIEYDHREPFSVVKRTELHNLDTACKHCHDNKTLHGWALIEGTGRRPMVPPDDPRHPNYQAPNLFDTG